MGGRSAKSGFTNTQATNNLYAGLRVQGSPGQYQHEADNVVGGGNGRTYGFWL